MDNSYLNNEDRANLRKGQKKAYNLQIELQKKIGYLKAEIKMEAKVAASERNEKTVREIESYTNQFNTKEKIINSDLPLEMKRKLFDKLYKKEERKDKDKDIELDPYDD